jgi:hypothetical protein
MHGRSENFALTTSAGAGRHARSVRKLRARRSTSFLKLVPDANHCDGGGGRPTLAALGRSDV